MKTAILSILGGVSLCGSLCAQTAVPNKITTDTTLLAGQEYLIDGYTYVTNGATLTIEPGAHIYAESGTGASASALIVTRGSKIMAEGTTTDPIIFEPLLAKSGHLTADDTGLWGGVVILGNGILNSNQAGTWSGSNPTQDVEGMLPASGDEALINFGGADNADNSGVFRYVSIRHAGIVLQEGNELNGLTLGGVGSGTQIDHVEVFANKDDSVEIFGGAVNLSHIITAFGYDDGLDCDEGYRGQVQFLLSIQRELSDEGTVTDRGDKGGEWDGNDKPNDATPLMLLQLANATFIGLGPDATASNTAINIRNNGAAEVYNSVFVNYAKMLQIDNDASNVELGRFNNGDIVFEGNIWYSHVAANNTAAGLQVSGSGKLTNDAFFTADNNQIIDPGFVISRVAGAGLLDVTPSLDSVVVTATQASVPAGMVQKDYAGAFGPYENWATGWTKLYEDGFFAPEGTWFEHPEWGWIYLDNGQLSVGSYVYFKNTDQWIWVAFEESTGYWTYLFR
jgi:hypothetical protein